jgi:hypothetical protein
MRCKLKSLQSNKNKKLNSSKARCDKKISRESKERERKEAEQDRFDKIPKLVLQNGMVQRMVERVYEIQDAERD